MNCCSIRKVPKVYLGRAVFEDTLDASVGENITQVLVLWYADQARTLRYYWSPIPTAFRDLRGKLAAEWLKPNGAETGLAVKELKLSCHS